MILANNVRVGIFALFGIVLSLCISGAFTPHQAHAAAVTLSSTVASSSNASTSLMKIGDLYKVQLDLSGTPSATSTPIINIFNMGSTSLSGSGTRWTYSTTSVTQWTTGAITFVIGWGGTAGEATTTITQTSITAPNVVFDKTAPGISGITSNATGAGVLKVGDIIIFTLATSTTERFGSVSGSYNSASLSWALTGVSTFVATYTVTEGQTDQSTALQISSITLSDAAGNTASGSGSDVVKTIDANSPSDPTVDLPAGAYHGVRSVSLSSTGSNSIYYNAGSAPADPSCSSGTLYSSSIQITDSQTIKAIGCDTAGNDSAVASFGYTITRSSGGGGGGSKRTNGVVNPATYSLANTPATTGATTPAGGAKPSFARDLKTGTTGNDVQSLQKFLNTHGFMVSVSGPGSLGNETTMFGALTRAALAKYQASKGITPAVGYLGLKTKAAIAAQP